MRFMFYRYGFSPIEDVTHIVQNEAEVRIFVKAV